MISRQLDLFRDHRARVVLEPAKWVREGPDDKFARCLFSRQGRTTWSMSQKNQTRFRDIELDKHDWSKTIILESVGRLLAEAGITDCTITESRTARGAEVIHLSMPSASFAAKSAAMQQVADAHKPAAAGHACVAAR